MHEKDHKHPQGLDIGSGKMKIEDMVFIFLRGKIYLETHKDLEEQRICLTLRDPQSINPRPGINPFAEVHLDKPVMLGNYPLKHLKVFVLSATIRGRQFDGTISPEVEKLDSYIRPKVI